MLEKLKLKRLLHLRLTELEELPSTLLALQRNRKYGLLMKNYLNAMKILPVHSNNSVVSAALLILFHNRMRKKLKVVVVVGCGFGIKLSGGVSCKGYLLLC